MTVHHIIETGEKEYFSLEEESDGTNRLFDYIPLILDLSREIRSLSLMK